MSDMQKVLNVRGYRDSYEVVTFL